jgi:hypothetical protein
MAGRGGGVEERGKLLFLLSLLLPCTTVKRLTLLFLTLTPVRGLYTTIYTCTLCILIYEWKTWVLNEMDNRM